MTFIVTLKVTINVTYLLENMNFSAVTTYCIETAESSCSLILLTLVLTRSQIVTGCYMPIDTFCRRVLSFILVFGCDQGLLVDLCMQDYKSLCTAVTICSTLVNN